MVSHTGSGGSDKRQRWERSGGSPSVRFAENVNGYRTCTFTVPSSRCIGYYVQTLMDSFMESPKHREIIVDGDHDDVQLGFAINWNGRGLPAIRGPEIRIDDGTRIALAP